MKNELEEDADEFVFDRLDICSCGSTGEQVIFICDYLRTLASPEFDGKRENAVALIHNNSEIVLEILNHFLASKDLITYGSSCRYAWFDSNKENDAFLEKLVKLVKELKDEE